MGIFDKFKKSAPSDLQPLPGKIEKTPSLIAAVPKSSPLPDNPEEIMNRLLSLPFIKVISKNVKDNEETEFIVEYMGEEYKFTVSCDSFELPRLFRVGHDFTDEEIKAMESAQRAVYSRMIFGKNNSRSFHLQIKLINAIVGDLAGIADISGERILSGRWARLAAGSDVPPAPSYLYCIQCVNGDKENNVWLHTHGLNRCGSIELEILNSDKENYNSHGTVIQTLASNIINKEPLRNEYEPQFAIRLPDNSVMATTWVRWETALKMLPKKILGGAKDRTDGHNTNTGVIFVYPAPEDYKNRKLSQINIYNKVLKDNPMMMISNEETERMKSLAIERLDYLKKLFSMRGQYKKFAALAKIGLEVDEKYRDGDMKEHIWFEIKEMNDDGSFSAELTQEAYYVESIKPGDIRICSPDEITDWVVYFDNDTINPDSVYRLEK